MLKDLLSFTPELNLIIQGFIAVIILGVFYTFWMTTRTYGGLIGRYLRFIGFGILFISVSLIEKMLINFHVIKMTDNLSMAQDILNLIGLILLAWGFSKLAAASKS